MNTPHEIATKRMELSSLYARASAELEEILSAKPQQWMAIRGRVKSDAAAEKEWEATETGIKEMRLRMQMKRMEKEMSAARSMLDVLNAEARNQW